MGAHPSDVSGRRQSQAANETGAHVGQDVAIQVWHYHNPVRVRSGVLSDLSLRRILIRSLREKAADTDPKTGAIEQVLVIADLWELLRDLAAGGQEHAIGHFPMAHSETGHLPNEPNTYMMFALCTAVTRFLPWAWA
jgi:hypothetical protein